MFALRIRNDDTRAQVIQILRAHVPFGDTLLHIAAINDHAPVVRALVMSLSTSDVNAKNDYNFTALLYAVWKERTHAVRELLMVDGIDVNAADHTGITPLYEAVRRRNTDVVKLLLAMPNINVGASVSPHTGWSVLHWAAWHNDIQMLDVLLACALVDVNMAGNNGDTALAVAVRGCPEAMRTLLATPNVDVNAASDTGWTALHRAAQLGICESVQILLSSPNIDVNALTNDGKSALHVAVREGHADCVEELLEMAEIDVGVVNNHGDTPTEIARRKSNHHKLLNMLELHSMNA